MSIQWEWWAVYRRINASHRPATPKCLGCMMATEHLLTSAANGEHAATECNMPLVEKDDCSVCQGARGGVKGNENVRADGSLICDYCSADELMVLQLAKETPSQ